MRQGKFAGLIAQLFRQARKLGQGLVAHEYAPRELPAKFLHRLKCFLSRLEVRRSRRHLLLGQCLQVLSDILNDHRVALLIEIRQAAILRHKHKPETGGQH